MSMLQIEQLVGKPRRTSIMEGVLRLSEVPREIRPDTVLYFIYNHSYDWAKFQAKFPDVELMGTGFLPAWTWHINTQGEANIRLSAIDKTDAVVNNQLAAREVTYARIMANEDGTVCNQDKKQRFYHNGCIMPAPSYPWTQASTVPAETGSGVYGYIFRVQAKDDELLHQELSSNGLRTRVSEQIALKTTTKEVAADEKSWVVFYVDFINTCDMQLSVLNDPKEMDAWAEGIDMLQRMGVPFSYLKKVATKLAGQFNDVQPIHMLEYQPPDANRENVGDPLMIRVDNWKREKGKAARKEQERELNNELAQIDMDLQHAARHDPGPRARAQQPDPFV